MMKVAAVLALLIAAGNAIKTERYITDMKGLGIDGYWTVLIPDSVLSNANGSVPVVVDLHGQNDDGVNTDFGLALKAESEGFAVVTPYGTEVADNEEQRSVGSYGPSWNAGYCCGDISNYDKNVNDTGFLRSVIERTLLEQPLLDTSRVYLSGYSTGCSMAQRFAAQVPGVVAAVACMSLYLFDYPAKDYAPTPILTVHGTADETVPYTNYQYPVPGFNGMGAISNAEKWGAMNNCTGAQDATTEVALAGLPTRSMTTKTYTGCKQGAEVQLVTLADVGHFPFGGAQVCSMPDLSEKTGGADCKAKVPSQMTAAGSIDTGDIMWQFLKRFTLPTSEPLGPNSAAKKDKDAVGNKTIADRAAAASTAAPGDASAGAASTAAPGAGAASTAAPGAGAASTAAPGDASAAAAAAAADKAFKAAGCDKDATKAGCAKLKETKDDADAAVATGGDPATTTAAADGSTTANAAPAMVLAAAAVAAATLAM